MATLMKQPALAQQPRAELTTAVRQLAERQLLTLTQTVLAGASAPQVTLVQVAQGEPTVQQASFLRRSKTCAALLAHLQQHGPTPLPALRERWQAAHDARREALLSLFRRRRLAPLFIEGAFDADAVTRHFLT